MIALSAAPPLVARVAAFVVVLGISGPLGELAAQSETWERRMELRRSERVDITVASEAAAKEFAARAAALTEAGEYEYAVRVAGGGRDEDAARVVIGTLAEEEVAELASRVGVVRVEEGFRLLGHDFLAAEDLLVAVLEDPKREGCPLTLWLGNDEAQLARQVHDLRPRWRSQVRVWNAGTIALDVPLSPAGHLLEGEGIDYLERRREAAERMLLTLPLGPFLFRATSIPRIHRMKSLVISSGKAYAQTLQMLDGKGRPFVQVMVHTHPEDLKELFGGEELGAVNPVSGGAHVLLADGLPDDGAAVVARATALAIAGPPAEEWMLDGLSIAISGEYWGRELMDWAGYLVQQKLVPTIAELRDPTASTRISPHILQPMRGMLARVLATDRGPRALAALWSGDVPLRQDAALDLVWRRALNLARARYAALAPAVERRRLRTLGLPFRHGVALVDGGRDAVSDYLDHSVEEELARAKEFGADSFSVSVFTSAEPFDVVAPRPRLHPTHASCSDLALGHAVGAGRRLGMRATLVLEPLTAFSGPRADVGMIATLEEDWIEFFDAYESMVEHYGLLAELLDCEVFCLGVELRKAADTPRPDVEEKGEAEHEDLLPEVPDEVTKQKAKMERYRLERWRALIARARVVFSRALTYTSRVGHEAEQVGFWSDLDFIGVTVFPEMEGLDDDATDAAIRARYRRELLRTVELARTWQRPALIMQTGLSSTADALTRTWVPDGETDPDLQARGLRLFSEALEEYRVHPGLRGLYLWNWYADPSARSAPERDFSPQGKPAEEVLPQLFGREQ